ncbi:hypothetical protein [Streptomyces malaysiense]|uniref:hypothetical protein n=1 Tax=Streptomyces malaysiense TaxID=1428626 RepID=UPI00142D4C2E|nr:hypothetical protein [Streptomyces malaysiense]
MISRLLGRSRTIRRTSAEAAGAEEPEPARTTGAQESSEATQIPRQQSAKGVRE